METRHKDRTTRCNYEALRESLEASFKTKKREECLLILQGEGTSLKLDYHVPIIAGAATLAAYVNAKHHIVHDINNCSDGFVQPVRAFMYPGSRKNRVLAYHLLEDHVRKQPDHPFLIFEGKTWSYKQFFESLTAAANWLMDDLGVQVDEIVAIDGGNTPNP